VLTSDVEEVDVLDVSYEGILDLTGLQDFIALEILNISGNGFSNGINLSNNTQLKYLDVHLSDVHSIDLSNNVLLEYLYITDNELEELDISNNALLIELYCGNPSELLYNRITLLDLSNNLNLEALHANNIPELTTIKLKNNNNQILTNVLLTCLIEGFECNTQLCIEVDDVNAAIAGEFPYSNWIVHYCCTTYSEECSLGIPSLNNTGMSVYPNPAIDELFIYNPTAGTIEVGLYNVSGKLVLQKEFNNTNNTLNISDIEAGIYFLVAETPQGEKTVKKVVKK